MMERENKGKAAMAGSSGQNVTAAAGLPAKVVEPSLKRKRGLFSKELRLMMYGYGDDPDPIPETVALVEDIVVDYITDMMHKSMDVAAKRGKLTTEDLVFLVRKDPRKFNRVKELLAMNEELKRARKAFDVDEEKLANDE